MSPKPPEELLFIKDMCERTQILRKAKGWTQEDMAELLGISVAAYQKNEIRSPLPHYLLHKFALLTGVSVGYLLLGPSLRSKKLDNMS